MSLTEICFWITYISGLCAAVVNPLAGVLLYIIVYHLNPEYQWWGENVRDIGLRTSMTVAVATVVGLVVRRPRFDGLGRQFPLPVALMLSLVAYAVSSLALGYGPAARGLGQAEKFAKIFIFVLILVRCVRRPEHYHLVIVAWLFGVFYLGYQATGNIGVHRGGRLDVGVGGPDFDDSGDLAAHLIASLPILGAAFFMSRSWWARGFVLITGALAVNTLILTRSRNAIFGLAAICLAAVCSLPRGYRWKGWAAIAVGTLLAVQLTDPGWWRRMSTISDYRDDPSAIGRILYWRAAVEMAADHPLGIGIGNFHHAVRDYVPQLTIDRSAHNTYLECLAELGVPGFTLLVCLLVIVLVRLGAIQRMARRFPSDVTVPVGWLGARFHLGWHAMALQTGLVGYLTCALFQTRFCAEDLWILLGLSACLGNVTLAMQAARAAPPTLNPVAPVSNRWVRLASRPHSQAAAATCEPAAPVDVTHGQSADLEGPGGCPTLSRVGDCAADAQGPVPPPSATARWEAATDA